MTNAANVLPYADLLLCMSQALRLLPPAMDSTKARVMLFAIGLQESRLMYRKQLAGGPARGVLQFERGTAATRGGVTGVMLHAKSAPLLKRLCEARSVPFDSRAIWAALETDDVLAFGLGRLLLWTDPWPLPEIDDQAGAWRLYLRTWRPGKPHQRTWPDLHQRAVAIITGPRGVDL